MISNDAGGPSSSSNSNFYEDPEDYREEDNNSRIQKQHQQLQHQQMQHAADPLSRFDGNGRDNPAFIIDEDNSHGRHASSVSSRYGCVLETVDSA